MAGLTAVGPWSIAFVLARIQVGQPSSTPTSCDTWPKAARCASSPAALALQHSLAIGEGTRTTPTETVFQGLEITLQGSSIRRPPPYPEMAVSERQDSLHCIAFVDYGLADPQNMHQPLPGILQQPVAQGRSRGEGCKFAPLSPRLSGFRVAQLPFLATQFFLHDFMFLMAANEYV